MFGGFGEVKLSSYTEKANVTANTYGLKEAVKSGDGSHSQKERTKEQNPESKTRH